jgi:hypothetical protein
VSSTFLPPFSTRAAGARLSELASGLSFPLVLTAVQFRSTAASKKNEDLFMVDTTGDADSELNSASPFHSFELSLVPLPL